jgi:hypothetical protein
MFGTCRTAPDVRKLVSLGGNCNLQAAIKPQQWRGAAHRSPQQVIAVDRSPSDHAASGSSSGVAGRGNERRRKVHPGGLFAAALLGPFDRALLLKLLLNLDYHRHSSPRIQLISECLQALPDIRIFHGPSQPSSSLRLFTLVG